MKINGARNEYEPRDIVLVNALWLNSARWLKKEVRRKPDGTNHEIHFYEVKAKNRPALVFYRRNDGWCLLFELQSRKPRGRFVELEKDSYLDVEQGHWYPDSCDVGCSSLIRDYIKQIAPEKWLAISEKLSHQALGGTV